MNDLVATWISAQYINVHSDQYDAVSWAVDELFNLAHVDPEQLLIILQDILQRDCSEKILGAIGAGVMEDMLVHNGERMIDKVVALSVVNKHFNKALHFTYIDKSDVSPSVLEKINKLKSLSV